MPSESTAKMAILAIIVDVAMKKGLDRPVI